MTFMTNASGKGKSRDVGKLMHHHQPYIMQWSFSLIY